MPTPHFLVARRTIVVAACLVCVGSAFAINAPTLLTPLHNEVGYMQHPNFTWTSVTGAVSYEIQVSNIADFSNIVDAGTSDITRYVPKTALYTANRYWHARAIDSAGVPSAWSSTRVYKLQAPLNNISVTPGMTLAAIRTAINNATTPAKITFGAGTYNFSFTDAYAITITGKQNLVIDGSNALFIVQRPSAGFLKLANCQNITIRNFRIDYDPLPHAVGRFLSVATDSAGVSTVKLQVEPGYPSFDAVHMLAHWDFSVILDKDPAKRGRMKPNTSLVVRFEADSVKRDAVDPSMFYLQLTTGSQSTQFALDDRVIVFARVGASALFYSDKDTNNVACDNIINYACPAGHYTGEHGSELKVLNCQSIKRPDAPYPRWFAGNADGVHARGNLIGPWIENCTFAGTGDDGVALYNKGIAITNQGSNNAEVKVLSEFMNLGAGHTFRVFDPRAGQFIGGSYTASACAPIDLVVSSNWSVTFAPPLPVGTVLMTDYTDKARNDQLFNFTRCNAGFVIRGNTFDGVRRFGTAVRAPGGVIRDNTYAGVSNAAIMLINEAATYGSGLPYSEKLLIAGNTIEDSGFDRSKANFGDIHIAIRTISGSAPVRAQNLIFVEGNSIKNWNQRAISLENAMDCTLNQNVIYSTRPDFVLTGANNGIYVNNTTNSLVIGNDLAGEGRLLTAAIDVTANNDNAQASGNILPP